MNDIYYAIVLIIKSIFCGFLFLAIAFSASAQQNRISWEYNYKRFGTENGLPSSETYQVYQDKSGLLWILTDRGVVRYDGFRFKTYTTEDGLCDNVNFRVLEDSNGAIWFIGYNGRLSVYKHGSIQPYEFNNELQKVVPVGKSGNVALHVNPDGSIIYSASGKKTVAIDKTGKVTDLMDGMPDAGYLLEYGNDFVVQRTVTLNDFKKVFLIREKKKVFLGGLVFNKIIRAKKHKQHYFLISDRKAYLNDKHRFKLISDDQTVIALDADDEFLYIGFYKNGVKKYRFDPKTKKLILVRHYLKHYSVSSVFKDQNGVLWFTTLEKGVYVLYDEAFQQLFVNGSKLNDEIRYINGNKDKVILTYHVGKWQQLYSPFLLKDKGKMTFLHHMLPANDGFVFHKGIVDWSDWKEVDDRYSIMPSYTTDTSIVGSDMVTHELVEIGRKSVTRVSYKDLIGSDLFGGYNWFHFSRKDKFFMLFEEGIFVLSVKDGKVQKAYRPVLLKRMDRLKYNPVWGLIAYSSGEGLFSINEETNRAFEFATELRFGKQILNVFFDEQNRMWVTCKRGIFLLKKKAGKPEVLFFLNRDQLSCAEIMDVYSYQDMLYLTTKYGVQRIDIRKVRAKLQENPISIRSIHAFANNKELEQHTIYPSKTDLIKISFLNKKLDHRNNYRYRFAENETWISSDKGEIILNKPSNGVYALEVSYLDDFNHWTKPAKLVVFEVEKIIFLRWYFILLYIGLVTLSFYGVLKYSMRVVNRKNELLNRMIELERMALAAQMNPHFIFNSLNSIHSFLLYEENENAEKYLLRFAKLIRQTLANSRVNYITIAEEYETLKNYILLENMRFKSEFTFRIECDFNQLPMYPCIPPMLIQPYVENAIIHGISKRKVGAELFIGFYKENDLLKIVIRDNGIGYDGSIKNKRDTGHKSYGTKITEERLKSLQGKNKEGFSVSVSVANEADTEFPGTEVVLIIPISSHLKNN